MTHRRSSVIDDSWNGLQLFGTSGDGSKTDTDVKTGQRWVEDVPHEEKSAVTLMERPATEN